MEGLIQKKRAAWKLHKSGIRAMEKGIQVSNLKKRLKKAKNCSYKVKSEGIRFRNEFWVNIARDMDTLFLKNAWGPLAAKIKTSFGETKEGYKAGSLKDLDMLMKLDGSMTTSL